MKIFHACEPSKGNCWGCWYADYCDNWNDISPSTPTVIMSDNGFVIAITDDEELIEKYRQKSNKLES